MARCPNCNGVGEIQVRTDTRFYRDVPCPSCDDGDVEWGRRVGYSGPVPQLQRRRHSTGLLGLDGSRFSLVHPS